jgi:hypothetical protein
LGVISRTSFRPASITQKIYAFSQGKGRDAKQPMPRDWGQNRGQDVVVYWLHRFKHAISNQFVGPALTTPKYRNTDHGVVTDGSQGCQF